SSYEERYMEILNDELEKYASEHPKKVAAKYVPGYIKLMKRMVQMRPTKAKKKISGQSLSLETANYFAAIHTVVQTCSLQKKNTLEEIKAILQS
ncbi:IS66 family transposase, partial [[Clostridium] innocuum]|nr:IS66 family transposase [[Clostridium] innocuum]